MTTDRKERLKSIINIKIKYRIKTVHENFKKSVSPIFFKQLIFSRLTISLNAEADYALIGATHYPCSRQSTNFNKLPDMDNFKPIKQIKRHECDAIIIRKFRGKNLCLAGLATTYSPRS